MQSSMRDVRRPSVTARRHIYNEATLILHPGTLVGASTARGMHA